MSKLSFLKSYGLNLSRKTSLTKTTSQTSPSNKITKTPNSNKSKTFQANIQEMKMVFETYDRNKDGKISKEEYKAMLRATTGKGIMVNSDVEAAKAFRVADKDGDGFIDFKEFMELHNNKVKSKDIESAFRVFDSDGDGKISAKELMEVLKRMGQNYSLQSCKQMIREVDNNGDGLINLAEFTTMMTTTMAIKFGIT
ncbi:calmodulin-like protein 30 [Spinacia oleracea]|uniref:Calmodulin-like protein 30 n=1 Tax=Spinacia oleracea TaxID=3562 RepID=A0A9R0JJX3_SPIOL|nr:calmodulin-like protein 30 [Spinacia oleracea]